MTGRRIFATGIFLLASFRLSAADPPLQPLRVCEVLENLSDKDGKIMAVVGRFSFREYGRFLTEEVCERTVAAGDTVWPNALKVVFDPKTAPAPHQNLEFDAPSVYRSLKLIRQKTSLGKFRFGTVDYDRWAVVFGRVEVSGPFKMGAKVTPARKSPFEPSPAQVVCIGESVILFIADPDR